MTGPVEIAAVEAASCIDHVDVVLNQASGRAARLRIDAVSGRAILAERSGIPSEFAVFVDLLQILLDAQGGRMTHVEVSAGDGAQGRIFFDFAGASSIAGLRGLPASVPLVIAARLDLPIHLGAAGAADAETAPEPLPAAIQQFIDQLAFGNHGGDAP